MSDESSIQRLPVEVDPFRLVEQNRIFDGNIPLNDFKRVSELLFKDSKELDDSNTVTELVKVHLEFTRNDTKLPVLKGQITAEMDMICQRCLDVKVEMLDTSFEVIFVSNDEQAERLQEGYDTWLVEDQVLFLNGFLEDEILLAMPYVIAHENCQPVKALIEALPEDIEKEVAQEKENPFAVLKDLKLDS